MRIFMKLAYHAIWALLWLLSLLPLRLLYVLSDGLFYLAYYVVRYRRPLVRKHLRDSFPEKSSDELKQVERDFYAWFCDYIVETVKLCTMSESEIRRRMVFVGKEKLMETFGKGQSVALYLGHYCNWEWVSSIPLFVGSEAVCGQIYHPLENPEFDKLFLRLRSRFHAVSIPMAETLRFMVRTRQEGKTFIIGFIADQVPFWNNIHYWTDFLHHDTPVLTGTERIARKMKLAVYYIDIRRERRGKYVGEFKLLTDDPGALPEYGVTELYFRALEKTIQRQPPFWLWTHNRWKRTREEWLRVMDPVTHKMRTDQ